MGRHDYRDEHGRFTPRPQRLQSPLLLSSLVGPADPMPIGPVTRSEVLAMTVPEAQRLMQAAASSGYRWSDERDRWEPAVTHELSADGPLAPMYPPGTPVPEPRRYWLYGLGLAVILLAITFLAIWAEESRAAVVWKDATVSTYGWPGDGPTQPLAGCGYKKRGGLDAGKPMPCRLTPKAPIVAHRTLPLGTLIRVCYQGRCSGARVGDRCGPGCDHNGVEYDLSWGLAKRLGFPYSIESVKVAVLS